MRRLLPFIVVGLILFGLVRLFRFVQKYDPALEHVGAGGLPDVSIALTEATIVSRTMGKTEWSLQADRVDVRRSETGGLENYAGIDLKNIRTGKLYREGKLEATLSAAAANYDQPNAVFTMEGPLKLASVGGDRMEANSCIWSEREDEVRLSKGVRATVEGHRITSPFVLYSPRKRLVSCPQGAEGTFDPHTLRASNLVWDIRKGMIECRGPVSGESSDRTWSALSASVELTGASGGQGKEKQTRVRRLVANDATILLRIEDEGSATEALR